MVARIEVNTTGFNWGVDHRIEVDETERFGPYDVTGIEEGFTIFDGYEQVICKVGTKQAGVRIFLWTTPNDQRFVSKIDGKLKSLLYIIAE